MIAQNAVEFRSRVFDARSTLAVEEMSAELDRNALQMFKCVGQHEQFALSIQACALGRFAERGGSDFYPAVDGVCIHERCHAGGLTHGLLDDRVRQHGLLREQVTSPPDFCSDIVRSGDRCVPQRSQLTVVCCFNKIVVMPLIEQFQADAGAAGSSQVIGEMILNSVLRN